MYISPTYAYIKIYIYIDIQTDCSLKLTVFPCLQKKPLRTHSWQDILRIPVIRQQAERLSADPRTA